VVTGCNGSRIPLHAWIDVCLCSPESSDGMMPGFLVERGYGKIGNCSDITYFTFLFYIFIVVRAEEFSLVISVENALYPKNGLC